jgi:hypothetical protein
MNHYAATSLVHFVHSLPRLAWNFTSNHITFAPISQNISTLVVKAAQNENPLSLLTYATGAVSSTFVVALFTGLIALIVLFNFCRACCSRREWPSHFLSQRTPLKEVEKWYALSNSNVTPVPVAIVHQAESESSDPSSLPNDSNVDTSIQAPLLIRVPPSSSFTSTVTAVSISPPSRKYRFAVCMYGNSGSCMPGGCCTRLSCLSSFKATTIIFLLHLAILVSILIVSIVSASAALGQLNSSATSFALTIDQISKDSSSMVQEAGYFNNPMNNLLEAFSNEGVPSTYFDQAGNVQSSLANLENSAINSDSLVYGIKQYTDLFSEMNDQEDGEQLPFEFVYQGVVFSAASFSIVWSFIVFYCIFHAQKGSQLAMRWTTLWGLIGLPLFYLLTSSANVSTLPVNVLSDVCVNPVATASALLRNGTCALSAVDYALEYPPQTPSHGNGGHNALVKWISHSVKKVHRHSKQKAIKNFHEKQHHPENVQTSSTSSSFSHRLFSGPRKLMQKVYVMSAKMFRFRVAKNGEEPMTVGSGILMRIHRAEIPDDVALPSSGAVMVDSPAYSENHVDGQGPVSPPPPFTCSPNTFLLQVADSLEYYGTCDPRAPPSSIPSNVLGGSFRETGDLYNALYSGEFTMLLNELNARRHEFPMSAKAVDELGIYIQSIIRPAYSASNLASCNDAVQNWVVKAYSAICQSGMNSISWNAILSVISVFTGFAYMCILAYHVSLFPKKYSSVQGSSSSSAIIARPVPSNTSVGQVVRIPMSQQVSFYYPPPPTPVVSVPQTIYASAPVRVAGVQEPTTPVPHAPAMMYTSQPISFVGQQYVPPPYMASNGGDPSRYSDDPQ